MASDLDWCADELVGVWTRTVVRLENFATRNRLMDRLMALGAREACKALCEVWVSVGRGEFRGAESCALS